MDFYVEGEVKKCRKHHRCYWCNEVINKGDPMKTISNTYEGDFFFTKFHPECKDGFDEWRKAAEYGEEWPDDGSMKRGSPDPKEY